MGLGVEAFGGRGIVLSPDFKVDCIAQAVLRLDLAELARRLWPFARAVEDADRAGTLERWALLTKAKSWGETHVFADAVAQRIHELALKRTRRFFAASFHAENPSPAAMWPTWRPVSCPPLDKLDP